MRQKIYEDFHKNTSFQRKIIEENNFTYRHIIRVINKYSIKERKKKLHLLDIGCGAGTLCFYYANKGYRVTGVDISNKAISVCRKTSKELNLSKLTNFKVVDFPKVSISGKYDYVIFTEVIEHLPNDQKALDSIFKGLKRNGYLFLSTPSKNAPLYKLGLLKDFDNRVGHLRRYNARKLILQAEKTGFKFIEVYKIEGILRNFLFTNNTAGILIRIINKLSLSGLVTFIDNITLNLFGESNFVLVLKKT